MASTARQAYQTELHDSAAANMAGMFSADVVWDTSRNKIVRNMTEFECQAIARRTTRELLKDISAIVRSLREYDTVRSNYAESYIGGLVQASGTMEEVEEARFKRRQALANQRLDDIAFLAVKYRKAAGYRAFCILSLADSEIAGDNLVTTSNFEIMSELQEHHYQLLLHADILRHLIKLKPDKYDFDFTATKTEVNADLLKHCRLISNGMKQIDMLLDGIPVAQCVDDQGYGDESGAEDIMQTYEHSLAVIDLFRRVNSGLSGDIAHAVNHFSHRHDATMLLDTKV